MYGVRPDHLAAALGVNEQPTAEAPSDAAVAFGLRQWRHQARSARARIAAPGAVPLTTRRLDLVAGTVIRVVGHPARQITGLPTPGCAHTRW
jgi:hypothetical protein